jgi:hypothetical protein
MISSLLTPVNEMGKMPFANLILHKDKKLSSKLDGYRPIGYAKYFSMILPYFWDIKEEIVLYFSKLEFLSPKNGLRQVLLIIAFWCCRRFLSCFFSTILRLSPLGK